MLHSQPVCLPAVWAAAAGDVQCQCLGRQPPESHSWPEKCSFVEISLFLNVQTKRQPGVVTSGAYTVGIEAGVVHWPDERIKVLSLAVYCTWHLHRTVLLLLQSIAKLQLQAWRAWALVF